MEKSSQDTLARLFREWSGKAPERISPLPRSGSDRQYFRLVNKDHRAIGVLNSDVRENKSFISFSRHFQSRQLPVPAIYGVDDEQQAYLQQDLGQETLLEFLLKERLRTGEAFPETAKAIYQKSLRELGRLQVQGGQGLDYGLCFPRENFDQQAMMWDLNYFKYFFLKLSGLTFDEQLLEQDFGNLTRYLVQTDTSHFLFRDFQARNIMVVDGEPFFIDYQGGRRGALQYDLASLLYQAKADIPHEERMALLDHYLDALEIILPLDRGEFKQHFFAYVLIRSLQVLGAYGFRGFFERKSHFLESIPYALENIAWLNKNLDIPVRLPALEAILEALPNAPKLKDLKQKWKQKSKLKVLVSSFSYKSGLPEDPSENGGGFVFDCRGIHNPGRYEPYKKLTGRDQSVQDFLLSNSKIESFLQNVFATVEPSVETYIKRDFTHLMVSFGCTGGQHRSVYCCDQLAKRLQSRYPIEVEVQHIEQEKKNWIN